MDDQQRARQMVGQFLATQGWAGEFAATALETDPQAVRLSAPDVIALVAAALRTAPEGWRLRKDGAGIAVTAPNGIPGAMTVKATGKSLQERLLYALCDSLLAGHPQRNEVMALDWEDAPSWAVFASTGPNGSLWHEDQPELIFDDPPYYGRKGGRWERISYAPRTARLFQRPDSPQGVRDAT